jgi:hypothetical protein
MEGSGMSSAKSLTTTIVIPNRLKMRLEAQIELTGEKQSEFIRRCLLEKLEVLEAKQAEKRMMENAGITAGYMETAS